MTSEVRTGGIGSLQWTQRRGGKVLLLGALAVLLQQIPVPYTVTLVGLTVNASLVHLHVGLLLAVAMLSRDRWVTVGVAVLIYLGWVVRALVRDYDMALWLPIGTIGTALQLGWTLLCAHWLGWPKSPPDARVSKRDLAGFAGIGLLLYPLGSCAIALLIGLPLGKEANLNSAMQVLIARHFGVAVLTFPLLMTWCEWRTRRPRAVRWRDWLWPLLLCGLLLASLAASERLLTAFSLQDSDRVALMDYRFALFALLGWCALRLRPRASMLLLVLTLFVLVHAMVGAAERSGTQLGFANLLYLAFELSVLLMAMLYFVVFDRDARDLAARLEEETRRDTATGLPNLAALRHHIECAQPLPATGAVGFLLLDHTDDLVAGFGLDIQVRVTTTVAARLADTDRPYLIGVGQFALLPAEGHAAEDHWQRAIDAVEAIEVDSGGQRFGLTPYLGVARWNEATPEAIEAALVQASELAFEARRRNEVRPLHDDDSSSPQSAVMREQLHAAADALACLRSGRIELHFQPIRPLAPDHPDSGAPVLAFGEVLCRLRGRNGELLYPDAFLGPIEAVGRTVELDLSVLRTLFELLREHPRALPQIRRLAINLTGQSLASSSFKQQFEQLLDQSPVPLSVLCFEITENAVISSEVHTRSFLDGLRKRGCSIAIDDFGKGMQSFARLKEVPVDIIKIDGAFVLDCAERGRDYALVGASVTIARAFKASTVAEYVETEAIADCLRELDVEWMQGYLYARPRPLAEMLGAVQ